MSPVRWTRKLIKHALRPQIPHNQRLILAAADDQGTRAVFGVENRYGGDDLRIGRVRGEVGYRWRFTEGYLDLGLVVRGVSAILVRKKGKSECVYKGL